MKQTSNRVISALLTILLGLLLPKARAEKADAEVGFIRIVNAVGHGEGLVSITVNGENIFPAGYKLGQKTGGLGLPAGTHSISIEKDGCITGTTKVTLSKGETLSLVGFAQRVVTTKEQDPPKWRIKIFRLKQSDPETGYRVAMVSLCSKDELRVEVVVSGKANSEFVYPKPLAITAVNLGKSKTEVVLKLGKETAVLVSPEDPGNYVVIFYEDHFGKVQALSYFDANFVVAG